MATLGSINADQIIETLRHLAASEPPTTLTLRPHDARTLLDHIDALTRVGFPRRPGYTVEVLGPGEPEKGRLGIDSLRLHAEDSEGSPLLLYPRASADIVARIDQLLDAGQSLVAELRQEIADLHATPTRGENATAPRPSTFTDLQREAEHTGHHIHVDMGRDFNRLVLEGVVDALVKRIVG